MLKARKARRQEIAAELQRNLDDRAAARGLLNELAGYERDRRRMAAVLRGKVRPDVVSQQVSNVQKRRASFRSSVVHQIKPVSSWVLDDLGMRGAPYHQTYLSRKSSAFYRGAAADRWSYDVRDEAVMRDADGNVIWFSNLGADIDEIAAAWQAVEDATTRKNGKVQIRIIVPLDADASPEEQAAALRHFCEHVLKPLDLPYSAVLHHPPEGGDQRNAHGHILTSLRPIARIAPYTWAFADEIRGELDGKNGVQMLRHLWAHSATEAAERSGRGMRYTGLSYAARGLPLEAGEHLGEARAAMVARGERVWSHERNQIKSARNVQRMILRDIDQKLAALIAVRDVLVADQQRGAGIVPPTMRVPAPAVVERHQQRATEVKQPVKRPTFITANKNPIRRDVPVSAASGVDQVSSPVHFTAAVSGSTPSIVPLKPSGLTACITPVPRLVASEVMPERPPTSDGVRVAAKTASAARPSFVRMATTPPFAAAVQAMPLRATTSDADQPKTSRPLMGTAVSGTPRPPSAIVETMREVLQTFEMRRSAKPRDTARSAWWRRRALADQMITSGADARTITARQWFELNPLQPNTPGTRQQTQARDRERLDLIMAGRGYVSKRPDGAFVQAIRASEAPIPDSEWWGQDHVQRRLADLRCEQQQVMERAVRQAGIMPTAGTVIYPARWTTNMIAEDYDGLRRWAEAPAFFDDLTDLSRRILSKPVDAIDQAKATEPVSNARLSSIPDGFGGRRDSASPLYVGNGSNVPLVSFDAAGRPTKQLLRLLHLAGQHPNSIAVATDGRLMVEDQAPAMLAPLLHGWRRDPVVAPLVWETVRLSRDAGHPVWPADVAIAVRAFALREAGIVSRPAPPVSLRDLDIP